MISISRAARFRALLAVLLLTCSAVRPGGCLLAQADVATVGDWIRVRPTGVRLHDFRGKIIGVLQETGDTISVLRDDATEAKIAVVDIMSVEVSRGTSSLVVIGSIFGAALGLGVGGAIGDEGTDGVGSSVVGLGIGLVAGAVIGSLIKTERWQETELGPP